MEFETELYGKYRTEMRKTRAAALMTEAQFCGYLTGQTRDMRSVRIQNEGILYYRLQKGAARIYATYRCSDITRG